MRLFIGRARARRDSVTFVTLPLDHADAIFPGTLKRANAARQELLWTLADADEVFYGFLAVLLLKLLE